MNKNEQEILLDFDEALKQIAEETPEMPVGFHDAWVHAVREAQENPEVSGTRQKRSIPWTRVSSIAAAFVILFVGTCVVGNQRLIRELSPEKQSTAPVSVATDSARKSDPVQSVNSNGQSDAPRHADAEPAFKTEDCAESAVMVEDAAPVYEESVFGNSDSAPADMKSALTADVYAEFPVPTEAVSPELEKSAPEDVLPVDEKEAEAAEIREQSFPERVGIAFIAGLKEFGRILAAAAVFPIPAVPVLALLTVILLTIPILMKKHKAKKSPENRTERK